MSEFLKNLMGEFPKVPEVNNSDVFHSEKIVLFKARATIDKETIFSNCYEFVIGGDEPYTVILDNKLMQCEKGKILLVNPGQAHSAKKSQLISQYIPIFIEKDFISELIYHMVGKHDFQIGGNTFKVNSQVNYLISHFIEECHEHKIGSDLVLQCLNTELGVSLLRCILKNNDDKIYYDKKLVKLAEGYLRDHCWNKLSLDEIAQHANYSTYHFIRIFRAETGKTPIEYLLDLKIEMAEKLLTNQELTITEVCHRCGFNNPSYFSNIFKRKKGVTPSKFRRMI